MEEKFAGGKFREIPCAVDIYFAGGKFRAQSKFANRYSEKLLHAKNTCYTVYNNDIVQSSKHFNCIMYADDTTLCSTLKINADATQLNLELNNVSQWLNLKKLSLNVKNKSNGFSYATKENNTT